MSSRNSTARAILYAFLANTGIALAKSWAAWLTGSGSMLAEAIHSFADAGNQVLLFIGLKGSIKRPDSEHPLGYGKVSYFWSFIVATLLFSVGGLFSIYEGLHKYAHPEPITQVWVAVVVLVLAIVLESGSLFGCLKEIRAIRGERAFGEWLRHTRSSELIVVLGEDVAALCGLCLALFFVSLAWWTGNPVFDAVGSACIGAVLVIVSVFLASRVRDLLVGRSADPLVQETIERIITGHDGVEQVLNTITMQFGPDTMLAAKIRLEHGMDLAAAIDAINRLERTLKAEIPGLKWCFIEPDVAD